MRGKSQATKDDNRFTRMLGQRYKTNCVNEDMTFSMNLIQSYPGTQDKILKGKWGNQIALEGKGQKKLAKIQP